VARRKREVQKVERGPGFSKRRRLAQRALLETIALDSPAGRRHEARLIAIGQKGGADDERLAAYERTLREVGALSRYEDLLRLSEAQESA
jgi:hypothetical protein